MIKYNRKKQRKRGVKLTVCIATISKGGVIGAADRMITAGDIQYQPPVSKIWLFNDLIAALVAGDVQKQKTIFDNTKDIISRKPNDNPDTIISIKEAAETYFDQWTKERNSIIQRKVFNQFDLTHQSFLEKQAKMSPLFLRKISKLIDQVELPEIKALIIGLDQNGPHIYTVDENDIYCNDSLGFAAIGAGAYHAESHLMFNKYSPDTLPHIAILLTHRAKKISETAPGVGSETDMIAIDPEKKHFAIFPSSAIKKLDGFYDNYRQGIQKTDEANYNDIIKYFGEISADYLSSEKNKAHK